MDRRVPGLAVLLLASCAPTPRPAVRPAAASTPVTEVGELAGAPFRIDIPVGWNGELMMYCHGYRGGPVHFDARQPDEMVNTFGALGVAVAQSGYSAGGYALREGARDTEDLRRHFAQRFGAPQATWISGSSLGGSITMMLMETFPTTYEGGLSLCAPLGPMLGYTKKLAFDPLVVPTNISRPPVANDRRFACK
jgi:pimeloyl-ACP methyl ester carboxylesterase